MAFPGSAHLFFCGVSMCNNIRIYHECEGRIEKSIPRIDVWHHEAWRVIINGDPEERIFLSSPHTNNGFLFLLTAVFIYFKISFKKSLNTLDMQFHMMTLHDVLDKIS